MKNDEGLLSISDAAFWLGITPGTALNWAKRGLLKTIVISEYKTKRSKNKTAEIRKTSMIEILKLCPLILECGNMTEYGDLLKSDPEGRKRYKNWVNSMRKDRII